jgi:CO dehydrogenase/acetyl-CoA synthase alpha subunit
MRWGYSIIRGEIVEIDIPKECDQCMKCADCCIITVMDGHSIASELNELADDGAWNCANCWRCIEVCPQGVDIFGFMMQRRREEEIPEFIRKGIDGILRNGFWFGDIQFNEVRELYGLPPIRLLGREKVALLMVDGGGGS